MTLNNSELLKNLDIEENNQGVSTGSIWKGSGENIDSVSPVDGQKIASLSTCSDSDYDDVIQTAEKAFYQWRKVPFQTVLYLRL